jgi:hypothetical protein
MRTLMAWFYFILGDVASRTLNPTLGHWFEWPYRLYSWLMGKSIDWQGRGPNGPWSDPPPNDLEWN